MGTLLNLLNEVGVDELCDLRENTVQAMNFLICNGKHDGYILGRRYYMADRCVRHPVAAHHHHIVITVLQ